MFSYFTVFVMFGCSIMWAFSSTEGELTRIIPADAIEKLKAVLKQNGTTQEEKMKEVRLIKQGLSDDVRKKVAEVYKQSDVTKQCACSIRRWWCCLFDI
uniref:Uncharacterized protein n=1 Tax=Acrobeloides nanus TaxID=290746 RepID=A0A914DYN1_9BILA